MKQWYLFSFLTLSLSVVGCGCEADLAVRVTPLTKELRVGEKFTPEVSFRGCSDTKPLADVVTWRSLDTSIVSTDGRTGTTVGKTPGSTTVVGEGTKYRGEIPIPVTVIP